VERGARHEEAAAESHAVELPFVDQAPHGLWVNAESVRGLADAHGFVGA